MDRNAVIRTINRSRINGEKGSEYEEIRQWLRNAVELRWQCEKCQGCQQQMETSVSDRECRS